MFQLLSGEGACDLGDIDLGAGLAQCCLKLPLIDREQKLAFFHQTAVNKMDFVQESRHAGTDIHLRSSTEATDEFVVLDNGFDHRFGRGHWG